MNNIQSFRTGGVWHYLSSRRAQRLYLGCIAILLISGLGLRLDAAIYGRQIVSLVSSLSTLRVGKTSKAETLLLLPSLQASSTGPYGVPRCEADECFFMFAGNGLPGRVLSQTENSTFSALLRWWGFRFESLNVWVAFTSGKVSYFSYHLMVSSPGVLKSVPPSPRTGDLAQW